MSNTVTTGQFTLVGGSAEAPSPAITTGTDAVIVKARQGNAGPIQVGSGSFTDGTGYVLDPGEYVSLNLLNAQNLHFRGTAGDKITWMGISI